MPQPLPHIGGHNAADEHIARHEDALALLSACRVMLDRQQAVRVAQSVDRQCHAALLAGAHMQREPLAPLMISVFAGSPLYSTVDDESVTVPQKYIDSQRYIIIKAKGDSMVPLIQNGDYVIAEIDNTPCQGELSLVRVESSGYEDEYTIKKFYRYDDEVELHSINTNYSPMFYPLSEIKAAQKIVYIIHKSRNEYSCIRAYLFIHRFPINLFALYGAFF